MAKKAFQRRRVSRDRSHRHEQGVLGRRGQECGDRRGKTLRDLRIAEVSKLDMKVEGGKVVAYRARVQLSFKYDA